MNAIITCLILLLPADRNAADELMREGRLPEAREAYETLLALAEEADLRGELLCRIGMTYLEEGDWWLAEERFGLSLAEKETAPARLHRGRAYFYAGMAASGEPGAVGAEVRALMNDALNDLSRCLELDGQSAEAWLFTGLCRRYLFDREGEAAAYEKALALAPGMPEAALHLAYCHELNGDHPAARKILESVGAESLSVRHHLALGRLAEQGQQFDRMREHFLAAVLMSPADAAGYGGVWRATAYRKLFKEFEVCMATVIARHPAAYLPHYYLGFCRLDAKQPEASIASFTKVLELNPKEGSARFQIAEALRVALDDEDAAVPVYLEVLRRSPGHADSVKVLSSIAYRRAMTGDFEMARSLLGALREYDPAEPLHSLNLALVAKDEGRLDEALEIYVQAEADFPFEPRIPNDRGLLLMGMGREDGALQAFRVALDRDPDCLDALENLGAYARLRGDFDEAVNWFRRAYGIVSDSGADPSKFRRYLDMIVREGARGR